MTDRLEGNGGDRREYTRPELRELGSLWTLTQALLKPPTDGLGGGTGAL